VKRCILHIGQSKTGTTAIQSFLSQNRKILKKKGVLYPGIKVNGVSQELFNHNAVADSLSGLKSYPDIEVEEYFLQFKEELKANNCKTLLLSGEHFFGGEPRVWNVDSVEEYTTLYIQKIKNLKKYLKGYLITLIVYLRPQNEWVESAISHVIRIEGLIRKKIYYSDEQYFELVKPTLDYYKLLNHWNNNLEPHNIICIPYRRDSLKNKSSVSDFIYQLGLYEDDLVKGIINYENNSSLSREYIELKKNLNDSPCSKTEERVRIYCLNKASSKFESGEKYRLSKKLHKDIQEYCDEINSRVEDEFIKTGLLRVSVEKHRDSNSYDSEESMKKATKYFYNEYYSFLVKLVRFEIIVKAYMRTNARFLHVVMSKTKIIFKNIF
jgi:hypothetical protein